MREGSVKWFSADKGYGFITSEGVDVFVHHSNIEMDGFRKLSEGQAVRFEVVESEKGLSARSVEVLS